MRSAPTDLVLLGGRLRFMGRVFPCTIGRGGLSNRKREGDGATPRGVHRLIGMLYRPDRIQRSCGLGAADPPG